VSLAGLKEEERGGETATNERRDMEREGKKENFHSLPSGRPLGTQFRTSYTRGRDQLVLLLFQRGGSSHCVYNKLA